MSRRAAARRFGVSAKTAVTWLKRFKERGETTHRRMGTPRKPALEAHVDILMDMLEKNPDWTLEMFASALKDRGIKTSSTSVSEFFCRRNITRKKKH